MVGSGNVVVFCTCDAWGNILDTSGNEVVASTYDAWGNVLDTSGDLATTLGKLNPLRYRSYVYDQETQLYYLQSRYYNPKVGRFLNADSLVTTGQGLLGNNMFAYCGNNPLTRADYLGCFWNEIGDFFNKVWKSFEAFLSNTFGAGSTTSTILYESETPIIPSPSPLTITNGTSVKEVITTYGDSSKFLSVYADGVINNMFLSSSAGIYINIGDFTLEVSLALDDISISGSSVNGSETNSLAIKVNLSQLKAGVEYATAFTNGNITTTNYTNASLSLWAIAALYYFLTTGEVVPNPATPVPVGA